MVLPVTNNQQKFPKTLRFYYHDKDSKRFYTFDDNLFGEPVKVLEGEINGTLTDEQLYMRGKINDYNKAVIHMGTGKGKSWVVYDTVCKKGVRVLILTHNIKTADDMYKGFLEYTTIDNKNIGLVHSKSKVGLTGMVDIMTHTSFIKKWKELVGGYDMILYDECDYNLSFPVRNDYDCMIGALIMMDTKYLYGFTGTPYRAEGGEEVLIRVFDRVLSYGGDYYFKPEVTFIKYNYKSSYLFETWHELRDEIINNEDRLLKQVEVINSNRRLWNLVLVKSIDECDNLVSRLPDSIKMNGQLSVVEEREANQKIAEKIEKGEGVLIVGTIDKIGRGVDIPPIDTLFLFSPVKFRGTVVQAVGRALRRYEGKESVELYDWCDMPILTKQYKDRLKSYKEEYKVEEFKEFIL